jgi:predicted DNA-binding protein with PD1-like motif
MDLSTSRDTLNRLIQIRKGEELIGTLRDKCSELSIETASLRGIGATNHTTLGFYHPSRGEYGRLEIREQMEVVALTGNVTLYKEKPHVHLHAILSDDSFKTRAGHVHSLIANPILEISLTETDERVVRSGEGPILLFE